MFVRWAIVIGALETTSWGWFAVAEGLGLTMNIFGYWMAREQVGTDGLVWTRCVQGWTAVQ